MNQGQEKKTCCASRIGSKTLLSHIFRITASLAICALTFGCFGITLYFHYYPEAEKPAVIEAILKYVSDGNFPNVNSFVEKMRSCPTIFLYIFSGILFTSGLRALAGAIFNIFMLVKLANSGNYMNQEQQDELYSCFLAWRAQIDNMITSLCVCGLSLGCLGFTWDLYYKVPKYTRHDHNATAMMIMDGILSGASIVMIKKWEGLTWMKVVKGLSSNKKATVWYIFVVSMFTTGVCALLSAIYNVVLLATPRLNCVYFLPTWIFSGKLLLDGALLCALVLIESSSQEESISKEVVLFLVAIAGICTIGQLYESIHITVALRERDRGERSDILPWNATIDGDVRCC